MSDDTRVRCVECANCIGRCCMQALAAGLSVTERKVPVGRDFATMLQNCSAFKPRGQ